MLMAIVSAKGTVIIWANFVHKNLPQLAQTRTLRFGKSYEHLSYRNVLKLQCLLCFKDKHFANR